MEEDKIDVIPLDKLISKYSQITKLARNMQDVYCTEKYPSSSKQKREYSVYHYLLELKKLKEGQA